MINSVESHAGAIDTNKRYGSAAAEERVGRRADAHSLGFGRGGQVLLKDTPGVLHVRIEAPVEMRVERVKQQLKKDPGATDTEEKLQKAAADTITTRDMACKVIDRIALVEGVKKVRLE